MSNALALAGVTAVLKDLLNNGLIDHDAVSHVGPVEVTALPPDRIKTNGGEPSRLNLFLYQVTPSGSWRNTSLPAFDGEGRRLTNPPLALDLHYLLTAYGAEEFHGEILLGYGMHILHETPLLSSALIRRALASPSPVDGSALLPEPFKTLAASELADQVEQVRIIPQTQGIEEISKLWAALQAHYRPTAAYQVSVVLITGRKPTRTPLPVQERRIKVLPFRQPVIETVTPQFAPAGSSLAIAGYNLAGETVQVRLGEQVVSPAPAQLQDDRIDVTLPAGLRAGVTTVQVVHALDLGTPVEPHGGFESNLGVFILRPTITATPVNIVTQVENGVPMKTGGVRVDVTPPVGRRQRLSLRLNQFNPPPGTVARAFEFPGPSENGITDPAQEETPSITIPIKIKAAEAGQFLVRLSVDAAESDLGRDPATGAFKSPTVTI